MESNSPKKIQFSVPVFQRQLDPQASEHVSKNIQFRHDMVINIASSPFLANLSRSPLPAPHHLHTHPSPNLQYQSKVWTHLHIQGFFFIFTIFYIVE
uniref:Uncharacterized protein n=1 Tax=Oncorhynchus kisutch TaxID=8019 RepID=A0A8C7J890_ONCKI